MIKPWKTLSKEEIKDRVFAALGKNVSFITDKIMGIPCSYLDKHVFDHQAAQNSPFLKTMVENPNHIGCHTLGDSESFFKGTHELEVEALAICAENIFGADPKSYDAYVSSGGTESNIQALWIFRNSLRQKYGDANSEIGVLFSKDTHYSIHKGINLLDIQAFPLEVDAKRNILEKEFHDTVKRAKAQGIRHFIFVANMGTTMFGTVDDVDMVSTVLEEEGVYYKIHVDAAFGGFIYPFLCPDNRLNFQNPKIMSIGLDAHKMLQAPYGTGIFITRKGLLNYAHTGEATYVSGGDCTLVGSRSGANATAIWMILNAYGSKGLMRKMQIIKSYTDQLCAELDYKEIEYIHNPYLNLVTIHQKYLSHHVEEAYHLVPDNHHNPEWWKVILMEHVGPKLINDFIEY